MAPHRLSMAQRLHSRLSRAVQSRHRQPSSRKTGTRSWRSAWITPPSPAPGTGNVPLGLLQYYTGLPTVLTGSTRSNSGVLTAGAGGTQPTFVDVNAG